MNLPPRLQIILILPRCLRSEDNHRVKEPKGRVERRVHHSRSDLRVTLLYTLRSDTRSWQRRTLRSSLRMRMQWQGCFLVPYRWCIPKSFTSSWAQCQFLLTRSDCLPSRGTVGRRVMRVLGGRFPCSGTRRASRDSLQSEFMAFRWFVEDVTLSLTTCKTFPQAE